MHYYRRNIGDYHKKAGRLSMLEHGAYTLLIDSCYDRERFPTEEEAIDWVWARTEEEISAVRFVLAKFFELRDGVYVQPRIEEEISKYHSKAENNARIAKEREENRRKRERNVHETSPEEHEAPPNQEPITNNQEPEEKEKEREAPPRKRGSRLPTDWVLPDDLAAWAKAERPDLDIRMEADRFRDYWAAKPGKDGVKLDWPATWRNWVRNAKNFARAGPQMRPRQDRRDDFYRQLRQGNGRDSNTERVINGEAERVD